MSNCLNLEQKVSLLSIYTPSDFIFFHSHHTGDGKGISRGDTGPEGQFQGDKGEAGRNSLRGGRIPQGRGEKGESRGPRFAAHFLTIQVYYTRLELTGLSSHGWLSGKTGATERLRPPAVNLRAGRRACPDNKKLFREKGKKAMMYYVLVSMLSLCFQAAFGVRDGPGILRWPSIWAQCEQSGGDQRQRSAGI